MLYEIGLVQFFSAEISVTDLIEMVWKKTVPCSRSNMREPRSPNLVLHLGLA